MSDPASGLAAAAEVPALEERFGELGTQEDVGKPRSLWTDAWDDLRHSKVFWLAVFMVGFFVLIALFPGLFTSQDPRYGDLANANQPPSSAHWFGTSNQGYDVYTRTIYGARPSIAVGLFATLFTVITGAAVGIIGGFYGGWLDGVTSRFTEIFFAIPLLLGSVLVLTAFPNTAETTAVANIGKVVFALGILGWTTVARIMRSSVIQIKQADYVQAARALGATGPRIVFSHILPNAMAPVIVVAMISLGGYIAAEATLSFLGIGLAPPAVSWGIDISTAATYVRVYPWELFFPAVFLSLAVLAFIMLGDAVRDALDPKLR
jgi:oligopeptide transport system permease protein